MQSTSYINEPATKKDIQELEERMDRKFATKDDLKAFATKDDLNLLRLEVNEKIDIAFDQLKNLLSSFADKMYSRIDPILKEIEDHREDRALVSNAINSLDKRVERLEQLQGIHNDKN
jgi:hypothetical protein